MWPFTSDLPNEDIVVDVFPPSLLHAFVDAITKPFPLRLVFVCLMYWIPTIYVGSLVMLPLLSVIAVFEEHISFFNGHVRQSVRNFAYFLSNVSVMLLLDTVGCFLLYALHAILLFPLTLLWQHVVALVATQQNAQEALSKDAVARFAMFLQALETAGSIFFFKSVCLTFGLPFQTTMATIFEYVSYLRGDEEAAAPEPPLVNGRLIGVHQVVRVHPPAPPQGPRARR